MLKLEIVLDQEKIELDGKYDFAIMHKVLDDIFMQRGLRKVAQGIYTDNGQPNDFAKFWSIIWALAEQTWFIQNVKRWIWYNSDAGENKEDFAVEDILEFCQKNNIGFNRID